MENTNRETKKKAPVGLIIVMIIILLLVGTLTGLTILEKNAAGDLLSKNFEEPLDSATTAKVTIDPGDGNLTLEKNTSGEQMLATGSLQYYENNGAPLTSVNTSDGNTSFTLTSNGGQRWLDLPWSDCNGGTEWSVYLNPLVSYELSILTEGGIIKIDLTDLIVTRVNAETGGGNMEITLPQTSENLSVSAKTGAGKVTINVGNIIKGRNSINASSGAGEMNVVIPAGVAARISITEGNVIADSELIKIDDTTYETSDYQTASDVLDITAGSGAGKVIVEIR